MSPHEEIAEELKTLEHDLTIDAYQPRYLGSGSEQIVFDIKGHPNVVAKVDKFSVERIVKMNRDEEREPDTLTDDLRNKARETMRKEEKQLSVLRRYFGGAVLREKRFLQQIPVTKRLLLAVSDHPDWFDQLDDGPNELWAIVRVQERLSPAATNKDASIHLLFDYLEKDQKRFPKEDVERWTTDLLDGDGKDAEAYLAKAMPDFRELYKRYAGNPSLRAQIRSFAEAAVKYTRETKEILDLAGSGNAILFDENGAWHLTLPDARYPSREVWGDAQEAVEDIMSGGDLGLSGANRLMNALNYARFVNALCSFTGSTERLRLASRPIGPIVGQIHERARSAFHS